MSKSYKVTKLPHSGYKCEMAVDPVFIEHVNIIIVIVTL